MWYQWTMAGYTHVGKWFSIQRIHTGYHHTDFACVSDFHPDLRHTYRLFEYVGDSVVRGLPGIVIPSNLYLGTSLLVDFGKGN